MILSFRAKIVLGKNVGGHDEKSICNGYGCFGHFHSCGLFGFEIAPVSGTATDVSSDGKASATVERIPVGRRVVEVKANTGATMYAVADVKAGDDNIAVNWGTTAVGAVYYELCKSQEIKDIDASEFSSAIDVTKHACLIDAAKIAADYIIGSIKSSSNYVKSTVTVTAKVYGYEGKTVQIADPSSRLVKKVTRQVKSLIRF